MADCVTIINDQSRGKHKTCSVDDYGLKTNNNYDDTGGSSMILK